MKMSLYSVSMCAMRPSARLSMSARIAGSTRSLARAPGPRARRARWRAPARRRAAAASAARSSSRPDTMPATPSVKRDRARADRRDEEERRAERADDAAEGRDAVDRAGHAAGALRRAQQQADAERRIHAEERDRKEQDRESGREAAGPHVIESRRARIPSAARRTAAAPGCRPIRSARSTPSTAAEG